MPGSGSTVAFSPDGALLAGVGSDDEEGYVWDAHSGCRIAVLSGHAGASPETMWGHGASAGWLITSSSEDDTVRLWKMPPAKEWDC